MCFKKQQIDTACIKYWVCLNIFNTDTFKYVLGLVVSIAVNKMQTKLYKQSTHANWNNY